MPFNKEHANEFFETKMENRYLSKLVYRQIYDYCEFQCLVTDFFSIGWNWNSLDRSYRLLGIPRRWGSGAEKLNGRAVLYGARKRTDGM